MRRLELDLWLRTGTGGRNLYRQQKILRLHKMRGIS